MDAFSFLFLFGIDCMLWTYPARQEILWSVPLPLLACVQCDINSEAETCGRTWCLIAKRWCKLWSSWYKAKDHLIPTDFPLLLQPPAVCLPQWRGCNDTSLCQMWMSFVVLALEQWHCDTSWVTRSDSGLCCKPAWRLHPQSRTRAERWLLSQLALLRSMLLLRVGIRVCLLASGQARAT